MPPSFSLSGSIYHLKTLDHYKLSHSHYTGLRITVESVFLIHGMRAAEHICIVSILHAKNELQLIFYLYLFN